MTDTLTITISVERPDPEGREAVDEAGIETAACLAVQALVDSGWPRSEITVTTPYTDQQSGTTTGDDYAEVTLPEPPE